MNRRIFWKTLILSVLFMCPLTAHAGILEDVLNGSYSGGSLVTTVCNKLVDVFNNSRNVLLMIGGFGLIGLAFMAIFGKLRWGWFASLALGLALVSISGSIIGYVTQERGEGYAMGFGRFNDTLVAGGKPIIYSGPTYNSSSGGIGAAIGTITNDVVNTGNSDNNNNSGTKEDVSGGARDLMDGKSLNDYAE